MGQAQFVAEKKNSEAIRSSLIYIHVCTCGFLFPFCPGECACLLANGIIFKCTRGSFPSTVNLFIKIKNPSLQPYVCRIRIKIAVDYFGSANYVLGVVLSASHALSPLHHAATPAEGTRDNPTL